MLKLNITPTDVKKGKSKVFIGDNIEIEVLRATNTRVDLGITAPKEIPILRENAKVKEKKNEVADTTGN